MSKPPMLERENATQAGRGGTFEMNMTDNLEDAHWLALLVPQVPLADRERLVAALDGGAVPETLTALGRLAALEVAKGNADGLRTALAQVRSLPAARPTLPRTNKPQAGLKEAIVLAYRVSKRRAPTDEELAAWLERIDGDIGFEDFFLALHQATDPAHESAPGAGLNAAEFVHFVYRICEDRGALPAEIDHYRRLLQEGRLTRSDILTGFFNAAAGRMSRDTVEVLHDGLSCAIMGTGRIVHLDAWTALAEDTEALAKARDALKPETPFTITGDGLRVSAITSLFRGGDFIEPFMDNITSQTCFDRHAELIIIDAASPEHEGDVIERYGRDHPNIRYLRTDTCIGIYEAWNIGVRMAQAPYLTNANLDDLRRADSFEIQAGALDALPFVDVVYQDFYYSFDPDLTWQEVAAFGFKSDLPVLTPYNMLRYNSPHNAPMWRAALHEEMGLFDASFKSAGDYEFWMRCLTKDKTFFKVNEPHVVYYQNPKGLSTRADTRGLIEGRLILKKYAPQLIKPAFMAGLDDYAAMLGTPMDGETDRSMMAQRALRDLAKDAKAGSGATP